MTGAIREGIGSQPPVRASSGERTRQLGEDRQIGMEPNPLDASHAQRKQRPLVLQAPELPLDSRAAPVERLPPLRVTRDKGMQAVGLDPLRARLAL